MVDKLPRQHKKSINEKPIEKNSPYYQQFKSRGLLYVLNTADANLDSLLKGMKGLGFVEKPCESRKKLEDRIDSDIKNCTKYKEDYCVAILTVTKTKLKNENQLIKKFHTSITHCPNLICKPKLFFFLTVTKQYCDEEESDSPYEYMLAHEADLFIYKDTSMKAVQDLNKFVKKLNEAKEELYVPDELTNHIRTIDRSKLLERSISNNKCAIKPKPTTHDSLTRRLMLGSKAIVIDKINLKNTLVNSKILFGITFINNYIDSKENPLEDDNIDLDNLKYQIENDMNFHIPDGEKILKKLDLFIAKNTENNQQ